MSRQRIEKLQDLEGSYFIYGDEELLIERAISRLVSLASRESELSFNLDEIDASEAGVEAIIDAVTMLPLLASRRLVIARNIDQLPKKAQQVLADYLDNPNPDCTLVMVVHPPASPNPSAVKKHEASVLYRKVSGAGETLKYSFSGRGREAKVINWVQQEFSKRGKSIEPSAVELLVSNTGAVLRPLLDVIERTALFVRERTLVSTADIINTAPVVAEQGVFELVDAVAERRRDISLYMLNVLVAQGESPHRILSLLLRQFRLIAQCKALTPEHGQAEIAKRTGLQAFLVRKCTGQARRYSTERLRRIIQEFLEAEVELHSTGYLNEPDYSKLMLERLIVRITG